MNQGLPPEAQLARKPVPLTWGDEYLVLYSSQSFLVKAQAASNLIYALHMSEQRNLLSQWGLVTYIKVCYFL